jgi:hypothetical protein
VQTKSSGNPQIATAQADPDRRALVQGRQPLSYMEFDAIDKVLKRELGDSWSS